MSAVIRPTIQTTALFIRRVLNLSGRSALSGLPVLAFVTMVLTGATLAGQTAPNDVRGRVVDPAGAVVAGARVTLIPSGDASAERRTLSQTDGTFRFANVPPGKYLLTVEASGFDIAASEVVADSSLQPLTVALGVATLRQTVTVQADAQTSIGRTTTPLTELPVNVDIIPAANLQTFAINDLVVALQTIPNVNAFNQYGVYEYYSFRGFTDSVQTVDGVRNEGNRVRTQLANVERVEVLKGPASVLYGTDAIGATVNIVLKKPSLDPLYDASVSLGSWRTTRGSVGAGGRVTGSRLLYRFDAAAEYSSGYRHDRSVRLNVTPTLQWQITDRDRLELRYAANRNDVAGDSGIPLQTLADGTQIIPDVPRNRRFNTPDDFALSTDHNFRAGYTRVLGQDLVLRATFSARRYDDDYWVAETLEVNPSNQVEREFLYFKHERRPYFGQVEIAGKVRAGVEHDLLTGLEYQHYRTRTTRSNDASQFTSPVDLFNPVETHVTWTQFPPSRYDYTRLNSYALYGQDTVALGTSVKLVGGVRVDNLRRLNHNNPVTNGVETDVAPTRRSSHAVTYRAGAVYQPRENVDLFGQFATAFRPNYNLQADGSPIDPETGRQFEVGQRLRLLDGRVGITTSLFNIEKRNIALSRPGGVYDLAGRIRSRGLENEVDWRPSSRVRLSVGYGYTDAVYADYITTTANFSGNDRPRTPRHSLVASSTFSLKNGISVSVDAQTRGQQFLNDANSVVLDGYGLLNVAASYTRGAVQYGIALNNLTGTDYWASALGNSQLYPGEPLRVVATIRVQTR